MIQIKEPKEGDAFNLRIVPRIDTLRCLRLPGSSFEVCFGGETKGSTLTWCAGCSMDKEPVSEFSFTSYQKRKFNDLSCA